MVSAAELDHRFTGKSGRQDGDVIRASEAGLGDVVRLAIQSEATAPYASATVVNKTAKEVFLFRPYVHTSDYSHTGGVTPYLGFEQFSVMPDTQLVLLRFERTPPR